MLQHFVVIDRVVHNFAPSRFHVNRRRRNGCQSATTPAALLIALLVLSAGAACLCSTGGGRRGVVRVARPSVAGRSLRGLPQRGRAGGRPASRFPRGAAARRLARAGDRPRKAGRESARQRAAARRTAQDAAQGEALSKADRRRRPVGSSAAPSGPTRTRSRSLPAPPRTPNRSSPPKNEISGRSSLP